MTICEYILVTQPEVLAALLRTGLLTRLLLEREAQEDARGEVRGEALSHQEVAALMRHDHWKRVRGVLRQVYGRAIK